MNLVDVLSQDWALNALLAASMTGMICGLLGTFIVLRNMSLIGDALSHAILPGVVVAFVLFGQNSLALFLGASIAGLLTAVVITWIQQKVSTKGDAAIGIVFITMFSIGVIGISAQNSKEGVHLDLKHFLFGNIFGVSPGDLQLNFGILLLVLVSVLVLYRPLFVSTFQMTIAKVMGFSVSALHYYLMLLLSLAVVASLSTVGVILVIAMLVTPASTALLLTHRMKWVLFWSAAIGVLSAVGGMLVAILLDYPPGAAMAVVAAVLYGLAVLAAPQKGKIPQWINRRRNNAKVLKEDIIKAVFKLGNKASTEAIAARLDVPSRRLSSLFHLLKRDGLLADGNPVWGLTGIGEKKAYELIRAHRLWEKYLVDEMGLQEDQIHEEAEELEHSLSLEILDEVDAILGYPQQDPHGSPIPPSSTHVHSKDLTQTGDKFVIAPNQFSPKAVQLLWKENIPEGSTLTVVSLDGSRVNVEDQNQRSIAISRNLFDQIRKDKVTKN